MSTQFGTVQRRSSNFYQTSKKSVPSEGKPRQTSLSTPGLATKAGVLPQLAPATEGLVAIASARAGEATEIMTVMTMVATLEVVAVLVVMAATLAVAVIATRRGSRNMMPEMTRPPGGPHFPPMTPVHRISKRANQPCRKHPLRLQRRQKTPRPKRLICLVALGMTMPLAVGLPFLLRSAHPDSPLPNLHNLPLHWLVCIRFDFHSHLD